MLQKTGGYHNSESGLSLADSVAFNTCSTSSDVSSDSDFAAFIIC